jgi:DNA primase
MNKEPILCFDGDKAGQRAAYRAVDMALPRLAPGKSVRFALLPEGQDPDDLYRSGGREAIAEVLGSARGLADMLWTRETEAGAFDTPERRAALEARLKEIIKGIGDETVRRYYSEDFVARLRQLMAPKFDAPSRGGTRYGGPPAARRQSGGRGWQNSTTRNRGPGREPSPPPSAKLSSSPIVRGHRSAVPAREALLLITVVNHPWLLENHAEEFADLEFLSSDADLLRRAILEAGIDHQADETVASDKLRAALDARGVGPLLARVEGAITHTSDWPITAGTATGDVVQWWTHVVTLHRKKRTLNKELKEAEHALGEEPTDANLAWLRDVQARLAALEGFEAQIEGFGALSGRAVGSI